MMMDQPQEEEDVGEFNVAHFLRECLDSFQGLPLPRANIVQIDQHFSLLFDLSAVDSSDDEIYRGFVEICNKVGSQKLRKVFDENLESAKSTLPLLETLYKSHISKARNFIKLVETFEKFKQEQL